MPTPTRMFVSGIGGQLGGKLAEAAVAGGFDVGGGHVSRPWGDGARRSVPFDKRDRASVSAALSSFRPDVVVDTGALHNVDYCEAHPDEAMAVNATGTATLAEECARVGAILVYVSTDFVFDGVGAPYSEEAEPNPISVYAASKAQGERNALARAGNVVVRPSVIYSWVPSAKLSQGSASGKPLNFAAWLVSQLGAGKSVEIVSDQVASPTLADDLAGAIIAIVKARKTGLFHTAGATPLSRYDFSVLVAKKLGLDAALVRPTTSSKLKQAARRPPNSSLVSDKVARETGRAMMPIDRALESFARAAGGRGP